MNIYTNYTFLKMLYGCITFPLLKDAHVHMHYLCGLTVAIWLNSSHKRFVVKRQYIMFKYI